MFICYSGIFGIYLFIILLLFIIYLLNFIVGAITFHSFSQLKYVDVEVDVIISRESFMYVRIEWEMTTLEKCVVLC